MTVSSTVLSVVAQISTTQQHNTHNPFISTGDPNGNHDSGYAPSNIEEMGLTHSPTGGSPSRNISHMRNSDCEEETEFRQVETHRKNGVDGVPTTRVEPMR